MSDLAKRVTEEQSQCLGYQVLERTSDEGPKFLLLERYVWTAKQHEDFVLVSDTKNAKAHDKCCRWTSQEALDDHIKLPWLKDVDDKLDAMSAKPQIVENVKLVGGYAERH